jgi:hypothetical protein
MRKIVFFLLVMLFSLMLFRENISVLALEQDQGSITLSWSKQSYYQGDDGALAITFSSQSPDELKVEMIEIKFNWTTTQETITIDLSDNPIGIPSNDENTFDPILFQVPQNATEGFQDVIIRIEGIQHGLWWYDFEWTSLPSKIEVKIDFQQLYSELNLQTTNKLDEALNSDYQNQEAIDLLDNATLEYNLATSLANQRRWQEAVSHLQQSQEYLDQAQEKEQQLSVDELTSAVATIIVLVIIGLIVSIVLGRKSKN